MRASNLAPWSRRLRFNQVAVEYVLPPWITDLSCLATGIALTNHVQVLLVAREKQKRQSFFVDCLKREQLLWVTYREVLLS